SRDALPTPESQIRVRRARKSGFFLVKPRPPPKLACTWLASNLAIKRRSRFRKLLDSASLFASFVMRLCDTGMPSCERTGANMRDKTGLHPARRRIATSRL
ncbi:unnamed protein product, partial [Ectocarpus fasciculatus]